MASAASSEDKAKIDETETPKSAEGTLPENYEGLDRATLNEATVQQENAIQEELKSQPMVGELVPMEALCAEFSGAQSDPEFTAKAKQLSEQFSELRRVRGDGNCFYRAIAFAQLERCIKDPDEARRYKTLTDGFKKRMVDLGFPEMTTEDFCDAHTELVDKIVLKDGAEPFTLNDLMFKINSEQESNYVLIVYRLMASTYLQENSDEYLPYIEEHASVREFCAQEIDPMWKHADHLCIVALCKAIGVSVRIEYMDRVQSPGGVLHYDVLIDEQPPQIHLLFRPGHYDILYK